MLPIPIYLHLATVEQCANPNDPKSYAGNNMTTGQLSQTKQVES